MNRRKNRIFGSAIVLLSIAGLLAVAALYHPSREIAVFLEGDQGQLLTATFIENGITHKEVLTMPATRIFNTSKLHFWIQREPDLDRPQLTVRTTVDGVPFGLAETDVPGQGVYGGVRTASLFRLRRERSFAHPAPQEVLASRVIPPHFPKP